MDDERLDSLFARYVEHVVVRGEPLELGELAGGDPELAAALRERIETFRRVQDALERRAQPLTGKTLLHYRVHEKLATGGMGDVYRAEDLSLERDVALKVLPAILSLDPERRKRFEREARILAGLNHRNITTIHGIEQAQGVEFLVLELVPGKTLAERLQGGPLALSEAVPVFKQITEALEAAHGKGVVHRDLKPANIMVMPDGQAKVLDFGLGKSLGAPEPMELRETLTSRLESTADGHILGTAAYMSPEQARGEEVDRRADVWSFGCVLYESLTGRRAFSGTSFSETMEAILDRDPDWDALPSETPVSLQTLLRKCLAKDAQGRLEDITEARVDLEEALERRPYHRDRQNRKVTRGLPAAVTPFVGREEEIRDIHGRLQDPACRLLTLVGPGGIGKTRLALEAARSLPEFFSDGVCSVPVSSIDSPALLFAAVGDALGLTLKDAGDPRALVLGLLRERELLLILDSFEHLAHDPSAVGEILAAAPQVKLLITSRVTTGLPGEWVWEVSGLGCPPERADSADEIKASPAVRLFLESARRVRTSSLEDALPDVVRLCRRVEGMPLAIELAAATLRERTCEEIASALDAGLDVLARPAMVVTDRNRSVRASFEHSWRLLSDEERALFQRLSLFRGGFRRQAAMEIADATGARLSALLRASFLRWDQASGRFAIHDLLRQFGEEKLRAESEAFETVRARFCRFFARPLTAGLLELGKDVQALVTLTEEIDNVRAAWSYAIASCDVEVLDGALDGLWGLYDLRGRFREGEETLGAAVEMLEGLTQKDSKKLALLSVRVLNRRAWFLWRLGFLGRAKSELENARSRIPPRNPQGERELAFLMLLMGAVAMVMGDFRSMRSLAQQAQGMSNRGPDPLTAAYAPVLVGFALLFDGAYDEAEALSHAGAVWACRVGDERGAAEYFAILGAVSSARGDQVGARRLLERQLEKVRLLEDQVGYYFLWDFMGLSAFASGNYAEAVRFHQDSLKTASRMAMAWCDAEARAHLGHALAALGKKEAAAQQFREALASARKMQAAPVVLESVAGLAFLGAPSDRETATQLLSQVCQHPAAKGVTKACTRDLLDQISEQQANCAAESEMPTSVSIADLESVIAGMTLRDERDAHTSSPIQIPIPPTPLAGREEELQSLNELIRERGCRMITLVGPGGIGKTRLAIEAVRQGSHRFRDGVCFASLASVWQVRELGGAIAEAIGFSASGGNLRASLLSHLRDKEMLLVLDGFEHLLAGKELLAEILENAPATKLLVTSRELLDLPGERVFEIPALDFPDAGTDPERSAESGAVQLFVQHALRRRTDFRPSEELPAIGRICRLLKGKPLAIELAATWVRELDCGAIADALERGPDLPHQA